MIYLHFQHCITNMPYPVRTLKRFFQKFQI
ncbi:hypothetical protein AbauAttikon1_0058 [Acinetobacter phage Abau_Attikon1]